MNIKILTLIIFLFLITLSFSIGEGIYTAEKADDYTDLFCRTSGWTGADGTYSIALDSGKTLWLFSDTLLGEVNEEGARSEGTVMINNSMAIQEGKDLSTVKFVYGGTEEKPMSIFIPPDGKGWFWLCDGIAHKGEDRITILLGQFDILEEEGVFGFNFKQIGLWKVDFTIEEDRIIVGDYTKLPYFKIKDSSTVTFGAAVMEEDDFTYIYGTEDFGFTKKLLVARLAKDDLLTETPWEFYTGEGWSENMDEVSSLMEGVCNEVSVHKGWEGKYILVTQKDGYGAEVELHFSETPVGPWENPQAVWVASEVSDTVHVYNSKAHPELSDEESGLLISYNVNTCSMDELMKDAGVYRPRFIRVKIEGE